jgi:hypothetical protein
MNKQGAPKNNKNAAKDDGATSHLHMRCTPEEKANWVHAAGGYVADWVRKTLNNAAKNPTL